MPTHRLVISPAAEDDLNNIYRYGRQQWGQAQSDKYLDNIKDQLWLLTKQPLMGIERLDLLPDARSLPIESHTVFYRVTSNQVEVIRVLHGRQDPHRFFFPSHAKPK